MNFDKAIEILELEKNFTKRELKKAYYKKAIKYYKNGYAKIGSDNPNSDAYYGNVERVLDKQRMEKLGISPEEPQSEELQEEVENEEN